MICLFVAFNILSFSQIRQKIVFLLVRRSDVVHLQPRRRRFRPVDASEEVEGRSQRSGHQERVQQVDPRRRESPARTRRQKEGRG